MYMCVYVYDIDTHAEWYFISLL